MNTPKVEQHLAPPDGTRSTDEYLKRLSITRRPSEEHGSNYQATISSEICADWMQSGSLIWRSFESSSSWLLFQQAGSHDIDIQASLGGRRARFSVTSAVPLSVYPAGETHIARTVGVGPRWGIAVEIDSALLQLVLDQEDAAPSLKNIRAPFVDTRLKNLMFLLRRAQREPYLNRVLVETAQMSIAEQLLQAEGRLSVADGGAKFSPGVRRILEGYIRSTVLSAPSVVEMAEAVGFKPSRFHSMFQNTFGTSPHQYLLRSRVDEAMQLLRRDAMSIQDIAYTLGFSSPAHFSAVYKKITRLTPSQGRSQTLRK